MAGWMGRRFAMLIMGFWLTVEYARRSIGARVCAKADDYLQ